jgi:hypothetical protein
VSFSKTKKFYSNRSKWPPSAPITKSILFSKFLKTFSSMRLLIELISRSMFAFNSSKLFGNGFYTLDHKKYSNGFRSGDLGATFSCR